MTIKELLELGGGELSSSSTAFLDAEVLLAHVLGEDKVFLTVNMDEKVDDDLVALFRSYLGRVKNGEPVAYILNRKEFFGNDFYVDNRVLVPRPETEFLVERVLVFIEKNRGQINFNILDIGTGSGNIAISIVKGLYDRGLYDVDVSIDAVDISEEALEVANINIEQHHVEDRVYAFQSDLLENIEDGESYDIVVANLPYIGTETHDFVAGNVASHEPDLALFGGDDGLVLYKKMFQQLLDKKIEQSLLLGEFGFSQKDDMEVLLNSFFDQGLSFEKDLAKIERFFIVE